jgi:Tol biopolymer transport system component
MPRSARLLLVTLLGASLVAMGKPIPKGALVRIPGWSDELVPSASSQRHSLSARGRWIAIESRATNLVEGEVGTGKSTIYLYDSKKDVSVRASRRGDGGPPALGAIVPVISAQGRYVAYVSASPDIVTPDTNNANDVFLFDRNKGKTERISVSSEEQGVTGQSSWPGVSKNGRWIVFESSATQLVPGDTNLEKDIFLRDRKKGTTTRVSLAADGSQADEDCETPVISDNGRWVAFTTRAALVPEDTNGYDDVYVVDLKKDTIQRASVHTDGTQGLFVKGASLPAHSGAGLSISANGRWVAFRSDAKNLTDDEDHNSADVFVRDLKKGTTIQASLNSEGVPGNSGSTSPSISPDGRFLVFESYATNLVGDDQAGKVDVFLRDLKKGVTERMSVGPEGESNLTSSLPDVSTKGKWVGFRSEATNLLAGEDGNASTDVFLVRR